MYDLLMHWFGAFNTYLWGVPMLFLILGTGLYLTILLRWFPIRKLGHGFRLMWRGRDDRADHPGISPFSALMTSLSATIGTGNIAGVATAIVLGGPGALFWMWCTALVGMATKYSEAVLAVAFRERDENNHYAGGPMYYIKNGLGPRWHWLAVMFAACGSIAGFGMSNGVQANSVAEVMESTFAIPKWITGLVLMSLVGMVILGGVKRISSVASKLVPIMGIMYMLFGASIMVMYYDQVPAAIALVIKHAFTPAAAGGGFAGASVWLAMRYGIARGIFSNEAGLGSAPIAHAAAVTNSPVRQGMVAMLGTFIDTLLICTMTGLAIIITMQWQGDQNGASLTAAAFDVALPGVGGMFIAISLAVFAFTTILGWSYYSERCIHFLCGLDKIKYFRIAWVAMVMIGANMSLEAMWLFADTMNALMAIPNLIALVLLSPQVVRLTQEYLAAIKDGTFDESHDYESEIV